LQKPIPRYSIFKRAKGIYSGKRPTHVSVGNHRRPRTSEKEQEAGGGEAHRPTRAFVRLTKEKFELAVLENEGGRQKEKTLKKRTVPVPFCRSRRKKRRISPRSNAWGWGTREITPSSRGLGDLTP